jgi:hypothetical protein
MPGGRESDTFWEAYNKAAGIIVPPTDEELDVVVGRWGYSHIPPFKFKPPDVSGQRSIWPPEGSLADVEAVLEDLRLSEVW